MLRGPVRHSHPCQVCQTRTPCQGHLSENYDGEPPFICEEFHLPDGVLNPDFLCEGCYIEREELREEEQRKEDARREADLAENV